MADPAGELRPITPTLHSSTVLLDEEEPAENLVRALLGHEVRLCELPAREREGQCGIYARCWD